MASTSLARDPLHTCKLRSPAAGDLAASRAAADVGGWSGVAQRRLVLTHKGLLERRPGDYEVG